MPVDLAGQHGGDDAGAQYRRLAAARGADDGQQAAGREPPEDVFARPPRGRRRSAGRRARTPAGRGTGTRRRAAACSGPGPRGRGSAPGAPSPRSRCGPRSTSSQPSGQVSRRRARGRRREEDLAAVGLTAHARGEVDGRAEVVGVRGARPRRCADPKRAAMRSPAGHGSSAAAHGSQRRAASSAAGAESNTETVESPSPIDLRKRPPRASTCVGDQLVVAHERLGHRRGIVLPQRGRAFDVGEQNVTTPVGSAAPQPRAGARRARPASPGGERDRSPARGGSRPRAAPPAPGRCPPRTGSTPAGASPVSSANAVAASA